MKMIEYKGKVLKLTYPETLIVKNRDPDWYAIASEATTSVLISVDPDPPIAEAFSRLIRDPTFVRTSGARIEGQGFISTTNGIEGYHRLSSLQGELRRTTFRSWLVDAKFHGKRVLNIQINTEGADWYGGRIWRSLLDSVDLTEAPAERVCQKREGVKIRRSHKRLQQSFARIGEIRKMPYRLRYLIPLAVGVNSRCGGAGRQTLDLATQMEACLRAEMKGLTNEEARARVIADRALLWAWLERYPAARHPEVSGFYPVVGALMYASGFFR